MTKNQQKTSKENAGENAENLAKVLGDSVVIKNINAANKENIKDIITTTAEKEKEKNCCC